VSDGVELGAFRRVGSGTTGEGVGIAVSALCRILAGSIRTINNELLHVHSAPWRGRNIFVIAFCPLRRGRNIFGFAFCTLERSEYFCDCILSSEERLEYFWVCILYLGEVGMRSTVFPLLYLGEVETTEGALAHKVTLPYRKRCLAGRGRMTALTGFNFSGQGAIDAPHWLVRAPRLVIFLSCDRALVQGKGAREYARAHNVSRAFERVTWVVLSRLNVRKLVVGGAPELQA